MWEGLLPFFQVRFASDVHRRRGVVLDDLLVGQQDDVQLGFLRSAIGRRRGVQGVVRRIHEGSNFVGQFFGVGRQVEHRVGFSPAAVAVVGLPRGAQGDQPPHRLLARVSQRGDGVDARHALVGPAAGPLAVPVLVPGLAVPCRESVLIVPKLQRPLLANARDDGGSRDSPSPIDPRGSIRSWVCCQELVGTFCAMRGRRPRGLHTLAMAQIAKMT